jgi:hypothetical protein
MEKEFVTYEQALALKELGFDEPCLAFYDGTWDTKIYFNYKRDSSGDYEPFTTSERLNWFGAPLKSQAFRWFREKHKLHSWVQPMYEDQDFFVFVLAKPIDFMIPKDINWKGDEYLNHEEAKNACIDKLIEIIKNKTDGNTSRMVNENVRRSKR